MNTQKNAAWYRHQSWHRQTIIPALMPCSNGAWRFLPLPDRAKHKQKKARNYAGLAAFHAIRCLAVPDAESFREIVAISHSKDNFMVACQRPLLQTLNGKIAEDIFLYDSNDWTLKQTVSSNSLMFDAKVSNQLLLTIALDDQDGLFKLAVRDLTSSQVNTLELGNDAYTAQLATNDQSHIISVILRINNDEDGSMLNTLFIIDLNTKEIIYKNTVTNGDDYLNCQVINNNKLIIDFYDHAVQTSYLKLINSQGMELSKRKVNGITTYGIATAENIVALAVNNYIEFMELG